MHTLALSGAAATVYGAAHMGAEFSQGIFADQSAMSVCDSDGVGFRFEFPGANIPISKGIIRFANYSTSGFKSCHPDAGQPPSAGGGGGVLGGGNAGGGDDGSDGGVKDVSISTVMCALLSIGLHRSVSLTFAEARILEAHGLIAGFSKTEYIEMQSDVNRLDRIRGRRQSIGERINAKGVEVIAAQSRLQSFFFIVGSFIVNRGMAEIEAQKSRVEKLKLEKRKLELERDELMTEIVRLRQLKRRWLNIVDSTVGFIEMTDKGRIVLEKLRSMEVADELSYSDFERLMVAKGVDA